MSAVVVLPWQALAPSHHPECRLIGPHALEPRVVYALRISGTHLTKIGQSSDPRSRLATFRGILKKVGATCALICMQRVQSRDNGFERALHWHFRAYQIGSEWFSIPPALVPPAFEGPMLQQLYIEAVQAGLRERGERYRHCTCRYYRPRRKPWRPARQLHLFPDHGQEAS